ncbi:MAG: hypothetical protein AAF399_29850, partial [Bacteroidota bacterium]
VAKALDDSHQQAHRLTKGVVLSVVPPADSSLFLLPQNRTFRLMNRLWMTIVGCCWIQLGLISQPADSLYFQHYVQPLDLEDDSLFESFVMLDSIVEDYQFFFTAEEHWKTINTQIQFRFLTYLHQKAGVQTLILEGGYAYGFLINQYLETGDVRLLRKALTDIPVCPDDQQTMYELLYEYNQGLPESERIQVAGIDLEHSPELALQVMSHLQPTEAPPAAISKMIVRIKELHQSRYYDEREVKRFFKRFGKQLNKKESLYRTYWGTEYDRLNLLVENTLAGYKFGLIKALVIPNTWQVREQQMFHNFLTLQPYFKSGGFYAQFGALHTDIEESLKWEFPSLAHRLNYFQESPVSDQVMTITRYLRKMEEQYQQMGEGEATALQVMVDQVGQRFPDQVVLCSMIAPSSPFLNLRKNAQFMLWISPDLEAETCD